MNERLKKKGFLGLYVNGVDREGFIAVDMMDDGGIITMKRGDERGEVHVHGQEVYTNDICCPKCHHTKLYNAKEEIKFCPMCER